MKTCNWYAYRTFFALFVVKQQALKTTPADGIIEAVLTFKESYINNFIAASCNVIFFLSAKHRSFTFFKKCKTIKSPFSLKLL